MPISKVDENLKTSIKMNSINKTYYFRKNIESNYINNKDIYGI